MSESNAPLSGTHEKPSRLAAVHGYLVLPHLVPVIVVELATIGFAVIAWGGWPPARLLAPLLLGMLGGQLAIGATNELADLPYDRIGKPDKPLARGDVSIRGARITVMAGLALMVGGGWLLGMEALAILALGTGLGIAYDLWLKRTVWSWVAYLLALPLLPIWVFLALGRPEQGLLLLYPLGGLATIGVHFAQALPDVAIDRESGLLTATSWLGGRRTFVFAWLATLSAPALALAAAGGLAGDAPPRAVGIAAGVALLAFLVNLIVLAADRRRGIAVCFPLVALSTVISGLAWTLAVAG